jgi:hypothetical protein
MGKKGQKEGRKKKMTKELYTSVPITLGFTLQLFSASLAHSMNADASYTVANILAVTIFYIVGVRLVFYGLSHFSRHSSSGYSRQLGR